MHVPLSPFIIHTPGSWAGLCVHPGRSLARLCGLVTACWPPQRCLPASEITPTIHRAGHPPRVIWLTARVINIILFCFTILLGSCQETQVSRYRTEYSPKVRVTIKMAKEALWTETKWPAELLLKCNSSKCDSWVPWESSPPSLCF